MSQGDMDQLCNEIDWVACYGRSLIFLQGDFGSCYYIIAQGTVDLYIESSKENEMTNCRLYGDLRGKNINEEDCCDLGKRIATLTEGKGFGELAILSATHQFRGATAVASDDQSLLLVLHASTYNAVFRRHHFKQQQLSSAMQLLREIPALKWYSLTKCQQMCYKLTSRSYSNRCVIAKAGQPVKSVFIINTGLVKAVHTNRKPSSTEPASPPSGVEEVQTSSRMTGAPLYVVEHGRGQLIGQWEVLQGLDKFQMTYVTCGPVEAFELSREHFEDVVDAAKHSFVRKQEPEVIPFWRQKKVESGPPPFTTSMRAAPPPATTPSATTHTSGPQDVELVSAFDGWKTFTVSREDAHAAKIHTARGALAHIATGNPLGEGGGDAEDSPAERLEAMHDLREVLPLLMAESEAGREADGQEEKHVQTPRLNLTRKPEFSTSPVKAVAHSNTSTQVSTLAQGPVGSSMGSTVTSIQPSTFLSPTRPTKPPASTSPPVTAKRSVSAVSATTGTSQSSGHDPTTLQAPTPPSRPPIDKYINCSNVPSVLKAPKPQPSNTSHDPTPPSQLIIGQYQRNIVNMKPNATTVVLLPRVPAGPTGATPVPSVPPSAGRSVGVRTPANVSNRKHPEDELYDEERTKKHGAILLSSPFSGSEVSITGVGKQAGLSSGSSPRKSEKVGSILAASSVNTTPYWQPPIAPSASPSGHYTRKDSGRFVNVVNMN
eukprot:CAMPEP_0185029088 /NCGR_PEP_ID=MMETSP1103-20130426/15187_1 /TAXON_ID=36769 /ORGANISM="Paraphysomonas bandaiensis, Strain Caron Lab Isolate" /LENGTH=714 /DNA_ID=CAMNT_0027563705 /DNA_START=122 /DNA_END=2266 /DNA_ORIENTATION=+